VKKLFKILGIVVALLFLSYVIYFLYLMWPSFFPKYPVNSCVMDGQVQRIHKITGFDDRYTGSGVPTTILESGSKGSISVNDPAIQPVTCP
jgi:hypothetical protein